MKRQRLMASRMVLLALVASVPTVVFGLDSRFSYQGELQKSGVPVDGFCDIRFRLFDAPSAGAQIGSAVESAGVMLSDGLFTALLDFGSTPFEQGVDRWLGLEVRCPAGAGGYTNLEPRQQLTPAPYALFAPTAGEVPWAGLQDVPPGFDDGVDDDTTYGPGQGVLLLGNQFSVDTSAIQARVATACSEGTSIRSIEANGGVVCEPDHDSGGTITGVLPGAGLTGGGETGMVTLDVDFGGSGTSTTAARSDHEHADSYQEKQRTTVTVGPVGSDSENGSALLFALADLVTINPCSQRFLLKLEPGVYDIGSESLQMLICVDIEGSGEQVTVIRGSGSALADTGTVLGTSNSEIRFLTIENIGGATTAVGFYANAVTSSRLTHLTVKASGAANNYAIVTEDSAISIDLVTAEATGGADARAIHSIASDAFQPAPTLTNVRATVSGGNPFVAGVYNEGSSAVMTNVNVAATGVLTGVAFGVVNIGPSLPVISGGGILVQGADTGTGVQNAAGAGLRIGDTSISVFFNNSSTGIENLDSSVTLTGIRVAAFLSLASVGVLNRAPVGSYIVDIDGSLIAGDSNTIRSDTAFATRVGASKLQGGPVSAGGGTVKCAGVYDENYDFSPGPGCP